VTAQPGQGVGVLPHTHASAAVPGYAPGCLLCGLLAGLLHALVELLACLPLGARRSPMFCGSATNQVQPQAQSKNMVCVHCICSNSGFILQ
jgi:hypothetical protein